MSATLGSDRWFCTVQIRQDALVDWAGAIGSMIAGFLLGGMVLATMVIRHRRRLRDDPTLAEQPVSVHADDTRSQSVGRWSAAGLVVFAALLTTAAPGPHPARFLFGCLLVEGALLALFGFFFGPNERLPDISASDFRSMSYLERYSVTQTYGAGRTAGSLRTAGRIALLIAVPGLLLSILVG